MIFMWILAVAVVIYIIKGIIIVQQAEAVIVERLGRFERELGPGLNFIFPIFEAPRTISWKSSQRFPMVKVILLSKKKIKLICVKPYTIFRAKM